MRGKLITLYIVACASCGTTERSVLKDTRTARPVFMKKKEFYKYLSEFGWTTAWTDIWVCGSKECADYKAVKEWDGKLYGE